MRFTIFIIACVLLVACQPGHITEIPVNPPRLVINAQAEDGLPWAVYVSHTYPLLDTLGNYPNAPGGVPGASVKLFDGDQLIEELTPTGQPDQMQAFVSSNGPVPGHTYTIRAEAPDFNPVSASYTHPSPVDLDDVTFEVTQSEIYSQNSDFATIAFSLNINVTFTDPPGDNYYQVVITKSSGPDPATSTIATEDYLFSQLPENQQNFNNGQGTLLDDHKFAGQKVTLPFRGSFLSSRIVADTVETPYLSLTLRTLSKEYYDFRVYLNNWGPSYYDPYAQPAIVKTNVVGGLGIFAGYAKKRRTTYLGLP